MKKILITSLYISIALIVLISASAFYIKAPILGELPAKPDFEISADTAQLKADVYYLADSFSSIKSLALSKRYYFNTISIR